MLVLFLFNIEEFIENYVLFSICYYTLKYYHPTNLINEINDKVLKGLFTELFSWKCTNYVLKIIINPSFSTAEINSQKRIPLDARCAA